jgi:DNA recombination protein RmuC
LGLFRRSVRRERYLSPPHSDKEQETLEITFLVIGLAVGAVAVWLVQRSRVARLETELQHERRATEGRLAMNQEFETTLKALTADFHKDAREDLESRQRAVQRIVDPIAALIKSTEEAVREFDKTRREDHGRLTGHLELLATGQGNLQRETANLVNALRAPAVRGRWGEIQLRRVVEAAGMLAYCDFDEQVTTSADGRVLRPDLVVRLPGGKQVVVDAKTPLGAYLEALEATDEAIQRERLRDHARQLRDHVTKLSTKAYWDQFESVPDFVVLFIPGDPFFAAALDQDPSLQEDAWRRRVVLATPSTLIGLLFVVAYGWRQEKVAENAREISELGKELYDRLRTLGGYFAKLGRSLESAVSAYNETVGALESRVLVSARRFEAHGVATDGELAELEPVERSPRALHAPELEESVEPDALPRRRLDAA